MRWCLSKSNNAKSDAENKAALRSNAYKVIIIIFNTRCLQHCDSFKVNKIEILLKKM